MTKEQLLSGIREEIIKAVPGIMELKFGCEVRVKYCAKSTVEVISTPMEDTDGEEHFQYVYTTHGATAEKVYLKRYFPSDNYILEIIGRTIRLSDVLATVGMGQHLHLKTLGNIVRLVNDDGLDWWDVRNDDLNLQDLPCLQFLYKILKKV